MPALYSDNPIQTQALHMVLEVICNVIWVQGQEYGLITGSDSQTKIITVARIMISIIKFEKKFIFIFIIFIILFLIIYLLLSNLHIHIHYELTILSPSF